MGPVETKAAVIADPEGFAAWLLKHGGVRSGQLDRDPTFKDGRTAATVYVEEREAEEFAEDTQHDFQRRNQSIFCVHCGQRLAAASRG